jgi:hypothetical protein
MPSCVLAIDVVDDIFAIILVIFLLGDFLRVKMLNIFNDFVDFSLNFRFLQEMDGLQKRASRAAGWSMLV